MSENEALKERKRQSAISLKKLMPRHGNIILNSIFAKFLPAKPKDRD